MYRIKPSSKYKKSIRKIKHSGKFDASDENELNGIINILASGKMLNQKYQDHALNGDMSEYRECHIKNNLLLIYYINNNELVLILVNIGSHSELF